MLAAGLLALSACGGGGGAAPAPSTTAAPVTTASPSTTLPATTTAPALPAGSCPAVPARAEPRPDRPRYVVRVDVRPAERSAEGSVEVRFVPDLDTDRLVFRLWPNGPRQRGEGAGIETGPVEVDGKPAPSRLDVPTTLVVPLAGGLRAGNAVVARVPWKLVLPLRVRDRISAEGDAARLGSFFPMLEWEPGVGWATDPPTTQFAEASTAPTADFDLTVLAPEGLGVLASGTPDRPGHWTATAMRDVAVAVGRFTTESAVAHAPGPVTVTVGVHAGMAEAPSVYLRRAVAVIEDFGRRFGPYPWPTFTVSVTPTLRSGIEYPGHVMQGPGTSGRSLSHEVGHQWFYALVGNNQARDPWLDEALATWAEARADGSLAGYRARVVPEAVRGRAGEPMSFWDPRSAQYYLGAYVQGAQALAALGPPELVDCALATYVAANAHGIARPRDLVAATTTVFPGAAEVLSRYGIRP
ncbi:MAG: hypothetical protein ACRD0Q_12030 [Acidimicrobiales bacterium]